jgi:uncharacterized protein (DUF58 family)
MFSGGNLFFILILLLNFIFLDFPAAKIIIYGFIFFTGFNFIYCKLVEKKITLQRKNPSFSFFSGITEHSLIEVKNPLFFPIHAIMIKDKSDLNISTRQMYAFLISLDKNKSKLVDYPICGRKRGKYFIGPTTANFTDISGIFSFEIEFSTETEVIIFPPIRNFSEFFYKSFQPQGNFKNPLPVYEDVSLMKGIKEYQVGDEIKRINWKISAKHDKILVNTYDYSLSLNSFVVLNLFEEDYNFREKDYYLEMAIEIAASLCNYLNLKKQYVGFITNARKDKIDSIIEFPLAGGASHFLKIIYELAVIQANRGVKLSDILQKVEGLRWGTSIYLITPKLNEKDIDLLLEIYKMGHPVCIIIVGPKIDRNLNLGEVGFLYLYGEIKENTVKLIKI